MLNGSSILYYIDQATDFFASVYVLFFLYNKTNSSIYMVFSSSILSIQNNINFLLGFVFLQYNFN